MPTFVVNTNVSRIPDGLAKRLVPVVAKALGKPESYVVVQINAGVNLSWGGSDEPAALSSLSSIGQISREKNKTTARLLMSMLETELAISPQRHYITFTDLHKENVGYSGTTFDDLI